jgi:2-methylcitrate dehydratase PrpD
MHSALGLALMQASGRRQVVIEGDPPAKAIYGAFPNHGGLLAARLAQQGLDARCEALTGEAALPSLVAVRDRQPFALDTHFGTRFYYLEAAFKPWPVSGHVTPYIEAALTLASAHSLRSEQIAAVHLRADTEVRAWLEPPEQRKHPSSAAAAANSVYFAVAKALVNGRVGLEDFTSGGLLQSEALNFTERMQHSFGGRTQTQGEQAGALEIVTTAGKSHAAPLEAPLGTPGRPMHWPQLIGKFRDCAAHSAGAIPQGRLDLVIGLIQRLEDVQDIRALTEALDPGD